MAIMTSERELYSWYSSPFVKSREIRDERESGEEVSGKRAPRTSIRDLGSARVG
jgi:hypothetical protein